MKKEILTVVQMSELRDLGRERLIDHVAEGIIPGELTYDKQLTQLPLLTEEQIRKLLQIYNVDIIDALWLQLKEVLEEEPENDYSCCDIGE